MLREVESVVLRDEDSLRSRILSWFYPNRGWKGSSYDPAGAKSATRARAAAVHPGSSRREETSHAV